MNLRPAQQLNWLLATLVAGLALVVSLVLFQQTEQWTYPVQPFRSEPVDARRADNVVHAAAAALVERSGTGIDSWYVFHGRWQEPRTTPVAVLRSGILEPVEVWQWHPDRGVEALPTRPSPLGLTADLNPSAGGRVVLFVRYGDAVVGRPRGGLIGSAEVESIERAHGERAAAFSAVFLTMACLGLVVGLATRDPLFVVMGAWVLLLLRILAVNEGWGFDTLPIRQIPRALLVDVLLPASLSLFGAFTLALFRDLVARPHLPAVIDQAGRVLQGAFLAVGLATVILPPSISFAATWLMAVLGMLGVLILSATVAVWHRDRTAMLLSATWLIIAPGLTMEILYNAYLLDLPPGRLITRAGLLGGALVFGLAMAQRMRDQMLARVHAAESAEQARADLFHNFDSVPVGLFRCCADGKVILFNPAFEQLWVQVLPTPPTAGVALSALLPTGTVQLLLSTDTSRERDSRIQTTVESVQQPGTLLHLSLSARYRDGRFECVVENVSERVHAERAIERMADHDALTDALNQRGLADALLRATAQTRAGTPCALLDLDIDQFKNLNELYGMGIADAILTETTQRIHAMLRADDSLARIGDSFKVVLTDVNIEQARHLAQLIHRAVVSQPLQVESHLITLSISGGLVPLGENPQDEGREALTSAARACAQAKLQGRNRICVITRDDRVMEQYLEELRVQTSLRERLETERFFLLFQPIVNLKDPFGRMACEALIRMKDHEDRTVMPSRFIPAAERNGQMHLIDRWVLTRVLQFLEDNPSHLARLDYLTVNMSAGSLNDSRFVNDTFAMLSDHRHLLAKLCFEITETVALADPLATRRYCDRVHDLGGRIALDDFGAGFTSFTYVRELPSDIIKIDGSFVRDLPTNRNNRAITRMIVELSHELGKRCVAEWVENPQVIAALIELGADAGQGFGLSRPVSMETLLAARHVGDLIVDPVARDLLEAQARRHVPA